MSAFTNQVNAANGGMLTFGPGQYIVDVPLTVRSALMFDPAASVEIRAPITMGPRSCWGSLTPVQHIIHKIGNFDTFTIVGSDVTIQDVFVDDTQSSGGWDFVLNTTNSGLERIAFRRIQTVFSTGLITDNNGPNLIVNLKLEDVLAVSHRGRGSYLTKAYAYVFLNRCTVSYVGVQEDVSLTNAPAWVFIGAQGLELTSVDATGNAQVGSTASQYGFYFENCSAVRLNTVMADTVGGFGLWFGNCQYVQGSTVNSSLCGDTAFVFAHGTKDVFIENFYASGRRGLPVDRASNMFYCDGTTTDICFGKGMTDLTSAPLFGGTAQTDITFTHLYSR